MGNTIVIAIAIVAVGATAAIAAACRQAAQARKARAALPELRAAVAAAHRGTPVAAALVEATRPQAHAAAKAAEYAAEFATLAAQLGRPEVAQLAQRSEGARRFVAATTEFFEAIAKDPTLADAVIYLIRDDAAKFGGASIALAYPNLLGEAGPAPPTALAAEHIALLQLLPQGPRRGRALQQLEAYEALRAASATAGEAQELLASFNQEPRDGGRQKYRPPNQKIEATGTPTSNAH